MDVQILGQIWCRQGLATLSNNFCFPSDRTDIAKHSLLFHMKVDFHTETNKYISILTTEQTNKHNVL